MKLLLLALFFPVALTLGADRPNVVVFLVDDMGVMDTSVPFLTSEGKAERQVGNSHEVVCAAPLRGPQLRVPALTRSKAPASRKHSIT